MRCKSFLDGDDEDTAEECSIIESSATRYIGQRQATIGDVECCKHSVCGSADLDDTASGRNWIRTVVKSQCYFLFLFVGIVAIRCNVKIQLNERRTDD